MSDITTNTSTCSASTEAEDLLTAVTATVVPEEKRLAFLPSHFKFPHFLQFEDLVFQFAKWLLPDYDHGEWEFMALSNGGLFLFPGKDAEKVTRVAVPSNYYEGELPCQAAGVIVSLFALNYLADKDCEEATERYHWLRDFALDQPYATEVIRAID